MSFDPRRDPVLGGGVLETHPWVSHSARLTLMREYPSSQRIHIEIFKGKSYYCQMVQAPSMYTHTHTHTQHKTHMAYFSSA